MSTEESKLSIIQAAKSVFSKKGFDGTSLRDIASVANVNHAIIRYHYGNKDELWNALVNELILDGISLREKYPFDADAADPKLEIRKFTRSRVAHFCRNPEMIKIMYLINIEGGERFERMDMMLRHTYRGSLKIMEQMKATGIVKDFSLHDLYYLLPSMIGARFIQPNFDIDFEGKKQDLEDVIDAHTDLIMGMVLK